MVCATASAEVVVEDEGGGRKLRADADEELQVLLLNEKKGQATSWGLESDGCNCGSVTARPRERATALPELRRETVPRPTPVVSDWPSFGRLGVVIIVPSCFVSRAIVNYTTHRHNGPTTNRLSLFAHCLAQCRPFNQSLLGLGPPREGARRRCFRLAQHESTTFCTCNCHTDMIEY